MNHVPAEEGGHPTAEATLERDVVIAMHLARRHALGLHTLATAQVWKNTHTHTRSEKKIHFFR